jgi:hypothetical protein
MPEFVGEYVADHEPPQRVAGPVDHTIAPHVAAGGSDARAVRSRNDLAQSPRRARLVVELYLPRSDQAAQHNPGAGRPRRNKLDQLDAVIRSLSELVQGGTYVRD